MKDKLTQRQYNLLLEALRRWLKAVQSGDYIETSKGLQNAWTGLGCYTTYKPAFEAGLMTYATGANPGYATWWQLTEKGAEIVQGWLDAGYNTENTLIALNHGLSYYHAQYSLLESQPRNFIPSDFIPPRS